MKKNKSAAFFLSCSLLLGGSLAITGGLTSCTQSKTELDAKLESIYKLYKAANPDSDMTYEEWLETIKGEAGVNGTNGTNGTDGISVTGASINGEGHLIITLSNDRTVDVGSVIGAAGAKGEDGKDGTNGTNGTNGTSITHVEINSDGHLMITIGEEDPVDCGVVVGAKGETGSTGAAGTPGKDGTNGVDGNDGVDGTNGKDGKGIVSIEFTKTMEDGFTDLYTITYTDKTTSTFTIVNYERCNHHYYQDPSIAGDIYGKDGVLYIEDSAEVCLDCGHVIHHYSTVLDAKFAGGAGTETDPLMIKTAEQFGFLNNLGDYGLHYKLANDIDLSNTLFGTTNVDFKAYIDGGSHTLSYGFYTVSAKSWGLFSDFAGSISNLKLEYKVKESESSELEPLIYVAHNALFENITLSSTAELVNVDNNDSLFINHINTGATVQLKNITNNANYKGNSYYGPFVGGYMMKNNDDTTGTTIGKLTYINCVNNGTLKGSNVGFFLGNFNNAKLWGGADAKKHFEATGCVNNGQVTANSYYAFGGNSTEEQRTTLNTNLGITAEKPIVTEKYEAVIVPTIDISKNVALVYDETSLAINLNILTANAGVSYYRVQLKQAVNLKVHGTETYGGNATFIYTDSVHLTAENLTSGAFKYGSKLVDGATDWAIDKTDKTYTFPTWDCVDRDYVKTGEITYGIVAYDANDNIVGEVMKITPTVALG